VKAKLETEAAVSKKKEQESVAEVEARLNAALDAQSNLKHGKENKRLKRCSFTLCWFIT
jgi:hypothetical protein